MDITLHHGSTLVILDIALPTLRRHPVILGKALLPKVPKGEVVGVGHQILDILALHFL